MCGITGYLSRSGRPIDAVRLSRMRDSLAHRGPDGAGQRLFDAGRIGIAHRRLAILDLSPAAAQPIADASGRCWLVFNGEIYNQRELRSELEARGRRFRSQGDAEVLVEAYAEWGEDCVRRLRGMWAFAIWDAREQRLFCSRDRFGIKPFYYFDDGDRFLFASEIRAILASGEVEAAPSAAALAAYLALPAIGDGSEQTCFEGIRRLPAAHCLSLSARGTRCWRYWELPAASSAEPSRDPAEELLARLQESMRFHRACDVPIGLSLSGGLDSTTLLALLTELDGPGQRAYHASYAEPRWDERPGARLVSETLQAATRWIEPRIEDFLPALTPMLWHLEEPPHVHGVYTRWCVAARAADEVRVLLCGQGADETLAGYGRYAALAQWDRLRTGRWLGFAGEFLRESRRRRLGRALRSLREPIHGDAEQPRAFAPGERLRESAGSLRPQTTPPSGRARSRLARRLLFDLQVHPLPELLRYDDKLTMAHSIEMRVPFLDHPLVEFVHSLPAAVKIDAGWRKLVLRRAMQGRLPEAVLWNPRKTPQGMPYQEWLAGALRPAIVQHVLEGPALREGWLDRRRVEDTLREPDPGGRRVPALWRWLWLDLWLRGLRDLADPTYATPRRNRESVDASVVEPVDASVVVSESAREDRRID